MFQYFNDISEFPRSNYETEDIYKIKGQILETVRKPRTGKAFQNFTGYQICHRKVSFQCPKTIIPFMPSRPQIPLKKFFEKFAKKVLRFSQILHNIYEGERRDENTKRNSVNATDR